MVAMKMLTALVVMTTVVVSVFAQTTVPAGCVYPPCQLVTDPNYYYPDWNDCGSYWACVNGMAVKKYCPLGTVFDYGNLTCAVLPTLSQFYTNPVLSCQVLKFGLSVLPNSK